MADESDDEVQEVPLTTVLRPPAPRLYDSFFHYLLISLVLLSDPLPSLMFEFPV